MDGLEVCRRVRESKKMVYAIMLTSLGSKETSWKDCPRAQVIA
jgi:DNA-binding response OmpR family regulator